MPKKYCYGLLPIEMADPHLKKVTPIIITEGESGYHLTDWSWEKEIAEKVRDMKNKGLGITPDQAERMMLASMFPKKQVPQLVFIRHEAGDAVVKCPHCSHEGPLMSDFSLLAAGFNGIKSGDGDDVDMQECGSCGKRSNWDNLPSGEEETQ